MNEGTISVTSDLTEGGCNACGPVISETYRLHYHGQELLLSELTVSSLVMAIVQQNGWQQEFKAEMMADYFIFTKESKEVKLLEDYNLVTYATASNEITSANECDQQGELFKQVNLILTQLFAVAPLDFKILND